MSGSRVIFKLDPNVVVAERTEVGPMLDPRLPARPWPSWDRFPFAAAVAEGIPYLRDIAGPDDRACLVQIEDDELVAAIDRDRALRAAAESDDAVVVDVDEIALANNKTSMGG